MMRVLLTGGGSGGHVNPAIAIADTIRMNQPDAEIAFVGVRGGKECDLVPRAGYPLFYVESQGIRRSLSLSNIKALFTAITSPHSKQTKEILTTFKPDIVIGTGGYVCWPMLCAAANAGIPTMVHESNCQPGLAVKMLQYSVDTILLNFAETEQFLKKRKKCVVVGNPLRGGFGSISKQAAREKLGIAEDEMLVLCSAGSLGSSVINEAVLEMLRLMAPARPNVRFVLSTGTKNAEQAQTLYHEYALDHCPNVTVVDYLYDMPLQVAAADVVISRAGAMSLSEVARMGKACVVIPSPYVADNHQLRNATAMADREAALLVEEKDFSGGALSRAVIELLDSPDLRCKLQKNILAFANADANRLIYERVVAAVEAYQSRQKKD
jgi:UDP-N-acetylglucosamine--N-acetylmuramyl-(pentapeptide) pyrophosphoryl-undecaprenol N-acetylglucosamine transferase